MLRSKYQCDPDRLEKRESLMNINFFVFVFALLINNTFAVNGYGAFRLLGNTEKSQGNRITGCTAIVEEQIIMIEARINKSFGIVDLFIQPYDSRNVSFPKVREIGFRGVQWVSLDRQRKHPSRSKHTWVTYIFDFTLRMWTRESQQFARNNPVQVTIFHFLKENTKSEHFSRSNSSTYLVMFVFIKVKVFKIEKSMKQSLEEKSLAKEKTVKMINDSDANLVEALQRVK